MPKIKPKNNNKKPFLRKITESSFVTFFSNIWILGTVVVVFFALNCNYKLKNYKNYANILQDSVAELKIEVNECNEEKMMAFNFVSSSNEEMSKLFKQIDLMRNSLSKFEEDERILKLKRQIAELQNQANSLNNQINSMRKTLNSNPKKGKSK